jgi:predicted nucleic acid-binding protein
LIKAILDTGPWVALIDRSETRHGECVQWLKNFDGRLYTTEAVLTEVLYLLNFSVKAQISAIDFVLEDVVEIVPADIQSLEMSKTLMKKYSDLPMDYADATILCLAVESRIHHIVTFDEKDFSIYALPGKKKFHLMP